MTALIGSGWERSPMGFARTGKRRLARRTPQPDPDFHAQTSYTEGHAMCASDRCLRPGLCHRAVRDRFDDRDPAVLPVLYRAFACAALALSGSREPIVGYGRIFGLKLPVSM